MIYSIESPDKIDAKESDYLYIKESQIPDAGKGLFTSVLIYKNEIISVFKGEILSVEEAGIRARNGMDRYFINMLDGTIMDSMKVKCFAKYANDSKGLVKTNFKINSTITLDDDNNVCLVAIRDINIEEEIFCSYGNKYWRKFIK
ncbi:MAG: SET domain-containing protein [Bacteroidetes bacterium]|nr:SET domain-containing protein [Bacteroidota bacterium]